MENVHTQKQIPSMPGKIKYPTQQRERCNLLWTAHSSQEKDNSPNHSCVSPRMVYLEYKNFCFKHLLQTNPPLMRRQLYFSIIDLRFKSKPSRVYFTYHWVSACCCVNDWLCRWGLFPWDRGNLRPSPCVPAISFVTFSLSLVSSVELLNTEHIKQLKD